MQKTHTPTTPQDGIHAMVPPDQIHPSALKLRQTYARVPDAPFIQKTFGLWMCLPSWFENGLDPDTDLDELFHFDPPGHHRLMQLGFCEAEFDPAFPEVILEDRGETEVVQDPAGRKVLYFKGRRQGFMPEYLDHPVKDRRTWEETVKWRLNPHSKGRLKSLNHRMEKARQAAAQGLVIQQWMIGGYMYLRSLIGPEELLYRVYDDPDLIHDCMRAWLSLADTIIARHQQFVTLDELFLGEDICFNHGPLISPDMIREFLFPYYQQLVTNIRRRQLDSNRHLYIQLDTDGYAIPVIDVYREGIGMDMMSPFEVASGCDVVEVGRHWPDLIISGGIDKRVLSRGPEAIDRHVETILPVMRRRGGYIPTVDHGIPPEVSWQQYLHYRNRCLELGS